MFYVNNKQVLGIFLNGNNYNYMAFGFGKIIPENRNAQFAYINLAQRYLSQYRVEYGNIQSGYDNFPVARLDYPVNGIFHSPLTYYYGGNIVPTKNIPVYINNGYCAIRGPVYNDISVSGNIVYFAANTDFQGHNVNIHPENFRSTSPYFDGTVMDNCNNFILHSGSRLSKNYQVTLYDCKKFIGWFNFFGDDDGTRFPGFRGFLHTCRDGVFNFNLMNMHGGGSDESVTNYYNFSCITNCNNIGLTIKGSPWQAWVHPNCYSSNCNINTWYIVPGFDRVIDCNFNIYFPSKADVEKSTSYSLLSNATNCNYNLNALDSNLFNYRSVGYVPFFDDLNNCNLNLLVNNAVEFGDMLGGNLHNCNIVFDNIKGNLIDRRGWRYLYNCNISGNVEAASSVQGFIEYCDGLNVNLNCAKSSCILPMYDCHNVRGNLVAGDMTYISYSSYMNLNVSKGRLNLINVEHSIFNSNGTNIYGANLNNCKFEINSSNDFTANGAVNSNFNMRNAVGTATLRNLNNVKFVERGGANYTVILLNECYNSWIYANTLRGTITNVYNTRLELKNNNPEFSTWRVNNCEITGFPTSAVYTTKCRFNASLPVVAFRNSGYLTWNNVWPHATPGGGDAFNPWYRTKAGLRSVDNFSNCYLICDNGSLVAYKGGITFNNINNMQCDIKKFYNGTVTANLPTYNMNIKLNVDCHYLNLGIFQAGPPHGFENSCISADNIYAKNTSNYYVQVSNGVRLYCGNFCDVPFHLRGYGTNGPVMLINNYKISNASCRFFDGGLARIGKLNFSGGASIRLNLTNGACVFINNAILDGADVNGSLLFVGSNVTWTSTTSVTNGGVIANSSNWGPAAHYLFTTRSLAWNVRDSGPWGPQSLYNFCTNV